MGNSGLSFGKLASSNVFALIELSTKSFCLLKYSFTAKALSTRTAINAITPAIRFGP